MDSMMVREDAAQESLLQPVVSRLVEMMRAQAPKTPVLEMPQAIELWRQARADAIRLTHAYNDACIQARAIDEVKGFGYASVDNEFQAMSAASRRAHALMPTALDALYDLQVPRMEVIGAQSRFIGDVWRSCSVEHHQMVLANPQEWQGYETRLVYAVVAPAEDAKPQG